MTETFERSAGARVPRSRRLHRADLNPTSPSEQARLDDVSTRGPESAADDARDRPADAVIGALPSFDLARLAYAAAKAHTAAAQAGEAFRLVVDVSPDGRFEALEAAPVSQLGPDATPAAGAGPDRLAGAIARARARGERRAAEILDGPEMLNSDTMADRLGVSRETVNRMRRRGELLGLEGARRGVRYPDWQLLPPGQLPLPRMPEFFRALGDPWSVYRFLLQVHPELGGRRALDAVRGGDDAAVLELARTVGGGTLS